MQLDLHIIEAARELGITAHHLRVLEWKGKVFRVVSLNDTVGLFISDTAYSPGGSPKQPSGEQSHVDATTTHRSRPPRYRPCGQSRLPQRERLYGDAQRAWEYLRR